MKLEMLSYGMDPVVPRFKGPWSETQALQEALLLRPEHCNSARRSVLDREILSLAIS
jgi:hypothetical protein